MDQNLFKITFLLTLIVFSSCKKPYNPSLGNNNGSFLVVEGVINTGLDSTIIKLSRSVTLDNKVISNLEIGARVTIESSSSNVYPVTGGANGLYYALSLNLNNAERYRVHVIARDSHEYYSDFVDVQTTPDIDSINWKVENDKLQLYVNTHDLKNSNQYYRFDYQETWEFHSEYLSLFYSNGNEIVKRDLTGDENVYTCWRGYNSSNITLGSTAGLRNNVLVNLPLTTINSTDERLSSTYSILVREYALSAAAFAFWNNLKKTSEQLGSIFDGQPSEIPGNIHCINYPKEQVIGYISASTVTTKRIFINNSELPASWKIASNDCKLDSVLLARVINNGVPFNEEATYFLTTPPLLIPVNEIRSDKGKIFGHKGSSPGCVDCTLRGTNKKPSFWQ